MESLYAFIFTVDKSTSSRNTWEAAMEWRTPPNKSWLPSHSSSLGKASGCVEVEISSEGVWESFFLIMPNVVNLTSTRNGSKRWM